MQNVYLSDITMKLADSSAGFSLSFREKIELAKLLDRLNVSGIELAPIQNKKIDSLLVKSVAAYRAIDAWNTDPVMSEESFQRLQRVMTEAGELAKPADYDQVVNNTFAEKAKG